MIYSFHHCFFWAKGGVETCQPNRAKIFRNLGLSAKSVYATTFPSNNIWKELEYLGYQESETLWLYSFFTDCKNSTEIYTLDQLENTFDAKSYDFIREGAVVKYVFPGTNIYYVVHMLDEKSDGIHRVEIVSNACMIRRDFYTYCKIYSEYFVPENNQAHLCLRRFFNENGTVAYEEIVEGNIILYKFPDRLLYSREELVGYMMSRLELTEDDVVLFDAKEGLIDQSTFILNAAPAKVGCVVHQEHYFESDETHILWHVVYEYIFSHADKIDFFITNTEAQSSLLREQLKKYRNIDARVLTIPAVALDKIRVPTEARKKHSLISAGRLSLDRRMDWAIRAVVAAKAKVPDLSLDIYGAGSEREKLQNLIEELGCGDYVRLCGFQKLDEVYQKYDAYISAGFAESFGIALLEAVGSGLPIIGFDIGYGTAVFIDEGKNGYKAARNDFEGLVNGIVKLFTEADIEAFRKHSYKKAREYLAEAVEKKWSELLCPDA